MSDTRAIGTSERLTAPSRSEREIKPTSPSVPLPGLGRLRRFASPLVLILLWQVASMAGLISPRTLAAPTTVVAAAWELLLSGELPRHLLVSLGRVVVGLSIGVSVGVLLALV